MSKVVSSFFSGLGGCCIGFEKAGHKIALMIEQDPELVQLSKINFPDSDHLQLTIGPETRQKLIDAHKKFDKSKLHIHFSCPCQSLSAANNKATQQDKDESLYLIRFCFDTILGVIKPASFSMENVPSLQIISLIRDEYYLKYKGKLDYVEVDACNFSTAQHRKRLICASPHIIQNLRCHEPQTISVKEAFKKELGHSSICSEYFKNNTKSRDGSSCIRSINNQAFTVTSSRSLNWCEKGGKTIRVMLPFELAILQGIPVHIKLPVSQRDAIKAIGNSIPTSLSECMI